jgi:hypothetical protein
MTPEEIAAWNKIMSVSRKDLWAQRKESPRSVTERPRVFQFGSTNFELLTSVYGRVNEKGRPRPIDYILQRVESGGVRTNYKPKNYVFPTFVGEASELPLVAELCIRTGNIEPFFAATARPTMPTVPLAIMMMQLEETTALNWDWFSNVQFRKIPKWLAPLREITDRQTHRARGPRGGPTARTCTTLWAMSAKRIRSSSHSIASRKNASKHVSGISRCVASDTQPGS